MAPLFPKEITEANEKIAHGYVEECSNDLHIPLDFGQAFGIKQKREIPPPDISGGLEKQKVKRNLVELSQFIVQKCKLMVYKEQLYEFRRGYWQLLNPHKAATRFRKILRKYGLADSLTRKEYTDIYNLLLVEPDIEQEKELIPPAHSLNLQDGTLDLSTMELQAHNPEDGFFHRLEFSYNDISNPGEGRFFEKFVEQASDGNPLVRRQLLELVALAITCSEVKYFYVLLGPSNTGKTQFGRFLEELLGRDNVESVAGVHDFANRFTTSALADKILGTCLDLPDAQLPAIAVGTIKQFVGDDPIKVEKKYKDGRTIYKKPLLLFAGNHPVHLANVSKERALLNRMVVIPFANPVREGAQQQKVYERLLEEAPYIIAQAIEAYRDLMERGFAVTRVEIPEEYEIQDSRPDFQAVKCFVENCCEEDAGSEITTEQLYAAYLKFSAEESFPEIAKNVLGRLFSEVIAELEWNVRRRKRTGEENQRGFEGIRLVHGYGSEMCKKR